MNGRKVVLGILGALVLVLGAVFWMGMSGGGRPSGERAGESAVGWKKDAPPAPDTTTTGGAEDGGVAR